MKAAKAPWTKTEETQKVKFSQDCPASSVSEQRILQREGDPGRRRLSLKNCIQSSYEPEKLISIVQAISVLACRISQEFQTDTYLKRSVLTEENLLITSLCMIAFPLPDELIENTFLRQRFFYTSVTPSFRLCLKYCQIFCNNAF